MPRTSRAEVDDECLTLRRSGLTFAEIGERLGLGTTTAWRGYQRALRRNPERATVEEARALELQRLDAMLAGLWPAASTGDTVAVDRALKISQRRARLLGLDAASSSSTRVSEQDHEGQDGTVSEIGEFRRRRSERRGQSTA